MKKIALQGAEFLPLDILEELALPIKGKFQEIFILFCLQPVYPTHTKQGPIPPTDKEHLLNCFNHSITMAGFLLSPLSFMLFARFLSSFFFSSFSFVCPPPPGAGRLLRMVEYFYYF